MGTEGPLSVPGDGEGPVRRVALGRFAIAPTAVTNAEFAEFVADTGHLTVAESDGWSFVFAGALPDDAPPTRGVVGAEWWRQVHGADWAHPLGPWSDVSALLDHPVVHVSWHDALAYAAWSGGRLPTEAEWEYAASGGSDRTVHPWGDELVPNGRFRANTWQGTFPTLDTGDDGWVGTCPVDAFEPNGFGIHNMIGNVWEWTADWWTNRHPPGPLVDPRGPQSGNAKVQKGGSHLCHASYCARYRAHARISSAPDSTTGHCGFRLAF